MSSINSSSDAANPATLKTSNKPADSNSAAMQAADKPIVPSPGGEKPLQDAPLTAREAAKQQQNAAILQAHIDVSLSSKNDPISLLYKTALEALGKALEPELGPNAIDQIQKNGPAYYTPEATADRIVKLSTGFFQQYQGVHTDMSLEEQVDSFVSLISGGVDKGFGEAREILDGLGVLEGDIASDIDSTYSLVMQGYADFRDRILNPDKSIEPKITEDSKQEISQSAAAQIASYRSISSSD